MQANACCVQQATDWPRAFRSTDSTGQQPLDHLAWLAVEQ